jgi:hypothetical protein
MRADEVDGLISIDGLWSCEEVSAIGNQQSAMRNQHNGPSARGALGGQSGQSEGVLT